MTTIPQIGTMGSRPLRVALFLQDLAGGGAERVMANLASGLAAEGHLVDLVLVRAEGPFMRTVQAPVRIVALNCGRVAKSIVPLRKYIDQQKPDAVISALVHVNVAAIIAAKMSTHRPVVLTTEHNDVALDRANTPELAVRVAYLSMPLLYRWADGVFGVSEGVAASVASAARLPRTRVGVLHNPVLRDDLNSLASQPSGHEWLDTKSEPVFLAIGRLMTQKNFSLLLRAFAAVRTTRRCRLIVLGEGHLRESLEAQVEALGLGDSVQFPGFVANPYPWIRACDVFVQSSLWEGLPTVLIEALALDCRIVATDCRHGPSEILMGGLLGALVPVNDGPALAAAMVAALSAPRTDSNRLARAREFSLGPITASYVAAIRTALSAHVRE